MGLRDSWETPQTHLETEAAGLGASWGLSGDQPGAEQGSAPGGGRGRDEPHWRDFARGEAQDFIWNAGHGTGKADSEPLFPDNGFLAANRRISILLMSEAPPLPVGHRP